MTTNQLIIVTCAYMVALVAVIYFTRATSRRVVGALTGGAVVGFMGMGAIVLGNTLGLWRVPIVWTPYFLVLFCLALSISVTPIYLVTWRVDRRFGWRGLAVCLVVVAIIGPPRDYLYAAKYPACAPKFLVNFMTMVLSRRFFISSKAAKDPSPEPSSIKINSISIFFSSNFFSMLDRASKRLGNDSSLK
jgi:hypothetical protein